MKTHNIQQKISASNKTPAHITHLSTCWCNDIYDMGHETQRNACYACYYIQLHSWNENSRSVRYNDIFLEKYINDRHKKWILSIIRLSKNRRSIEFKRVECFGKCFIVSYQNTLKLNTAG